MGPNQLKICSCMAPFIRCLMILLFPLGYPIAKLLDCIVGHEEQSFSKPTLTAFLKSQHKALNPHEVNMSTGAINLSRHLVGSLMLRKIFKLYEDTEIDMKILNKIKRKGYSRIPIYNSKEQCTRILIVKSMLFSKDFIGKTISECDFKFHYPVPVSTQNNAYQALLRMKEHKTSILMVVEKENKNLTNFDQTMKRLDTVDLSGKNMVVSNVVGVICLKDIFEDILQEELEDQDHHFDSQMPNNQFQYGQGGLKEIKEKKLKLELKDITDDKQEPLI